MKEIVSDTIIAMDQIFRERRIQAQVKMPDKVNVVSIDIDRIIQVMLNLLSNAAKFCECDKDVSTSFYLSRVELCASMCATTGPASMQKTKQRFLTSLVRWAIR